MLAAKSANLEVFVSADDPRINVYVRNAHFRQLANSCWSLQEAKGFKDVCRFIDAMAWYYVCEYPELLLRWMRRVFVGKRGRFRKTTSLETRAVRQPRYLLWCLYSTLAESPRLIS